MNDENPRATTPSPSTQTSAPSERCPACDAEVGQAKFCPECGTSLAKPCPACPSCGHRPEGTPKFCPECGTQM